MPITVELQDMFSYSLLRAALAVALVAVITVIGIMVFRLKKKPKKQSELIVAAPIVKPVSAKQIKDKYCALINELEMKRRDGKVSNRKAYQELSRVVRRFVYEMTGIKVHHNTLDEIQKLNMPNLYRVIEECYAPEFSVDKDGSIYDTMKKARMVIKEWR